MATLNFSITSPDVSVIVEMLLNDVDTPRILTYLQSTEYGKVTENIQQEVPDPSWTPDTEAGETEENRPTMLVQEWVTRDATTEETARAFAQKILDDLLRQTVEYEKQLAVQEAMKSVTPIEPITE